jgi:hypothetical protein
MRAFAMTDMRTFMARHASKSFEVLALELMALHGEHRRDDAP